MSYTPRPESLHSERISASDSQNHCCRERQPLPKLSPEERFMLVSPQEVVFGRHLGDTPTVNFKQRDIPRIAISLAGSLAHELVLLQLVGSQETAVSWLHVLRHLHGLGAVPRLHPNLNKKAYTPVVGMCAHTCADLHEQRFVRCVL